MIGMLSVTIPLGASIANVVMVLWEMASLAPVSYCMCLHLCVCIQDCVFAHVMLLFIDIHNVIV